MSVSQIAERPKTDESEIKYCRICAHVIPSLARKCTKCDSWQGGFRSRMPLTDTSMSMFLAFVSVMTIVVPPAARWIARESFTRVAIVAPKDNGDLQVAVSNVGRRPTVLRSYRVDFLGRGTVLPHRELTLRNPKAALLMRDTDSIIDLFGAEKITLPESKRSGLEKWMKVGVVKLTTCVKESGSGVAKANALARPGTCESEGLVARTDSIAASHLSGWIEGLVLWEPDEQESPSS